MPSSVSDTLRNIERIFRAWTGKISAAPRVAIALLIALAAMVWAQSRPATLKPSRTIAPPGAVITIAVSPALKSVQPAGSHLILRSTRDQSEDSDVTLQIIEWSGDQLRARIPRDTSPKIGAARLLLLGPRGELIARSGNDFFRIAESEETPQQGSSEQKKSRSLESASTNDSADQSIFRLTAKPASIAPGDAVIVTGADFGGEAGDRRLFLQLAERTDRVVRIPLRVERWSRKAIEVRIPKKVPNQTGRTDLLLVDQDNRVLGRGSVLFVEGGSLGRPRDEQPGDSRPDLRADKGTQSKVSRGATGGQRSGQASLRGALPGQTEARIKPGSLIERVVVDDLTPEMLQDVMVTVELKASIDPSKAVILIAGKPGNPRIVRFFLPGKDQVRVLVEAGGLYDSREVAIKVGRATRLRTTALLSIEPYPFRANTVELRVDNAPRASGANTRYNWTFGDGQRATTQFPWTTHSYPPSGVIKTYQASVSFNPETRGGAGGGTVAPQEGARPIPTGTNREVTLRETVVRWPRPVGEALQRAAEGIEKATAGMKGRTGPLGVSLGSGQSGSRQRRQKLRNYAVGYEVYQAMRILGKREVTIEDVYRLKQEGRISPWAPRPRTQAEEPGGEEIVASYAGPRETPQGGDEDQDRLAQELDRLAQELCGKDYEFEYVPGRLVNARKGDIYLTRRVDVPGISAVIDSLGQTFTHCGLIAEDRYAIRDMSAQGKTSKPKKEGKVFFFSESDYEHPGEVIPWRLNPIFLRNMSPGIRERSVDEAIVGGAIPLDTSLLLKPLPENEAEDRPIAEAVVEAARQFESSTGLPGVRINYYKLFAYTDALQMGMCSSYVRTACERIPTMPYETPLFDYSSTLRKKMAEVCYDDVRPYLLREAWKEAGAGDIAWWMSNVGKLDTFAENAANQIVNTLGWDDSDNISHDWADYSDERFGRGHTVSPDNLRPRWHDADDDGREKAGWGRPWGREVPLEYELGSYRCVRKDGGEPDGNRPAGRASRFKLVLHKLKCDKTEESTDEVYLMLGFLNREGRMVKSYTTKVYKNLNEGDEDDPDDGDEVVFTDQDRENEGWMDIGDGLTVTVRLYEQDNGRTDWFDSDDRLGSTSFEVNRAPIPAGSTVVFGEPPGRRQDDDAVWTFEHKDPSPFVSDYKYRIWYQTIYAPARERSND